MTTQSPTRLDFIGSTLDIWPLYLLHDSTFVFNSAINIMTEATIKPREQGDGLVLKSLDLNKSMTYEVAKELGELQLHVELADYFSLHDHSIELISNSQAPLGSGLGASSSLLISLITEISDYLEEYELTVEEILQLAQAIETKNIQVPTGTQDYLAALHGGFSKIYYHTDGFELSSLSLSHDFRSAIEERLYLIYTGKSHFSAIENWAIYKNRIEQDRSTIQIFDTIAKLSSEFEKIMLDEDIDGLVNIVGKEWDVRKQLLPNMEIPKMRQIVSAFGDGYAFKACGAGGGGTIMLFGPPGNTRQVRDITEQFGASLLDFQFYE